MFLNMLKMILKPSEIKRVLKKGGRAIVQVPFYHPIPDKTIEDKSITSKTDLRNYMAKMTMLENMV